MDVNGGNPKNMGTFDVANPLAEVGQLNPPTRLLCGPGPSNAHPRVHAAMSLPMIGHMDEAFVGGVMGDIEKLLNYAWQTSNSFTLPISGTGSAAWEAAVANLTVPGDGESGRASVCLALVSMGCATSVVLRNAHVMGFSCLYNVSIRTVHDAGCLAGCVLRRAFHYFLQCIWYS
eukprot:GHVQ01025269.1.p1 GENE.GHVQ01025269.1~~GHVQ01025269.1.p1  ORF type:complete len:175 (+),score=16.91 GHVQ01025269.1:100-624(+)